MQEAKLKVVKFGKSDVISTSGGFKWGNAALAYTLQDYGWSEVEGEYEFGGYLEPFSADIESTVYDVNGNLLCSKEKLSVAFESYIPHYTYFHQYYDDVNNVFYFQLCDDTCPHTN